MIRSRVGLAVLALAAIVLAVVLALDLHRAPVEADRAVAPGLATLAITSLEWTYPDRSTIAVTRTGPTATWGRTGAAVGAAVDPGAIDAALAALRGGRWQRRRAAAAVTGSHVALVVHAGARTLTVRVPVQAQAQASVPGQTWIETAPGGSLLVDDWVARALAPDPLALVQRVPLAAAGEAAVIELATPAVADRAARSVMLGGLPRALAAGAPLLVDARVVAALESQLAALEITALPAGPSSTPVALVITLRGHTGPAGKADDSTRVELHARCASACECPPQTVYATSPSGPGCVSAAAATALAGFVDQLAAPPLTLAEPRPLPETPASITLVDASQLVLSPPTITLAGTTTTADPARIEELVTVLGLPATPAALPTTAPIATLATPASTLRLYANDVVARAGEPVALQLGPGAAAILRRPGAAYRDLTLWREDPLTIHAITIQRAAPPTGATSVLVRGAVIGEWTRDGTPLAAPEAELAEALASSLAAPRVLGDAARFPPRYVVTIAVAAPSGAAASHSLTVGAPRSGCPLHALEADRLLCARLAALAP